MFGPEPIKIEGLKDLQGALRRADGESQKKLRLVFNRAAELVIDDAQGLIPRQTGNARASLRARSGQREATVAAGGRKAVYYPFLEFGNKVKGGHGVGRGDSVPRAFVKGGRYIWPAYVDQRKRIMELLAEGLAQTARDAGLDVT